MAVANRASCRSRCTRCVPLCTTFARRSWSPGSVRLIHSSISSSSGCASPMYRPELTKAGQREYCVTASGYRTAISDGVHSRESQQNGSTPRTMELPPRTASKRRKMISAVPSKFTSTSFSTKSTTESLSPSDTIRCRKWSTAVGLRRVGCGS
eukprot:5203681-Prymnesium_polylepis.2